MGSKMVHTGYITHMKKLLNRMVKNLAPERIYNFIVKDFEGAWDSISANPDQSIGRGNFMFARQAMNLHEFVARFYGNDANLHKSYSDELFKIERRYFTALPGPVAAINQDFVLPHLGNTHILLWSLFDLIRNGLAHQYQQIIAELTDGKYFYITLDGATYHRDLSKVAASRSSNHLGYGINTDGDLRLLLDPGTLFLDFKGAIVNSDLLKNSASFQHLSRPRSKSNYNFDLRSLENSLIAGNHIKL
jgi:hypothetical protein